MLELVYRATEDVVAVHPDGYTYVAAVAGDVLTPAQVADLGVKDAPRRLRTTDATPR